MKDSEIKKAFDIPNSTFYDWKKRDDYRKKILEFFENLTVEEFKKIKTKLNKKATAKFI
jgi:hypothetical protein